MPIAVVIAFLIKEYGLPTLRYGSYAVVYSSVFWALVEITDNFLIILDFLNFHLEEVFIKINSNFNNSSGSLLTWGMQVVATLGIWQAFVDTFSLFQPVLIAMITFKVLVMLLKVSKYLIFLIDGMLAGK